MLDSTSPLPGPPELLGGVKMKPGRRPGVFHPVLTSVAFSPTLAAQRPLAEGLGIDQKPVGPAVSRDD